MSHSGSNCWRRLAEKPHHPAQEFPESVGAWKDRALANT